MFTKCVGIKQHNVLKLTAAIIKAEPIDRVITNWIFSPRHGVRQLKQSVNRIEPGLSLLLIEVKGKIVTVTCSVNPNQKDKLRQKLQQFFPLRKGYSILITNTENSNFHPGIHDSIPFSEVA